MRKLAKILPVILSGIFCGAVMFVPALFVVINQSGAA